MIARWRKFTSGSNPITSWARPSYGKVCARRNQRFTCAQLFWWFNMYAGVDRSLTPRPMYPADGRKIFDIYAWPYPLRSDIKKDLGEFPFPGFWGPAAGVTTSRGPADAASRWIAASAKWIEGNFHPTLNLVYLPHLDYNLQRLGPDHPEIASDLGQIDEIVGDLIEFFEQRSVRVLLLSEYGIEPVDNPVHLNRLFRGRGWLVVKEELGRELLDYGASRVFAVATTRSLTSTSKTLRSSPPSGHCLPNSRASRTFWATWRKARLASTTRARAISSRWPGSVPGSPIITGWRIAGRPISRAPSTFTEAGLRSGGVIPGSVGAVPEAKDRVAITAETAWIPYAYGRYPAGRRAGARVAWTPTR